ncbi:MAG: putative sulfate exporter family transporter [Propionicimonas sp.]
MIVPAPEPWAVEPAEAASTTHVDERTDAPARHRPWLGAGLSGLGAGAAIGVGQLVPGLSAMLVAILLGALVANVASLWGGLPAALEPGLAFASRRLLRLGVVLLGLQLVLGDIAALGWPIVLGVVAIVGGTMGGTLLVGRWLRVDASQALLIAGGFSICGAAAVAGVDGVLARRKDAETATAVALVVLFGTVMIAVMPTLAGLLGLNPRTAGIWTGASVHEVAQVVAAAGIIGPEALRVAVVVKLARVLMLAPVLGVVSWRQRAELAAAPRTDRALPPLVPLFVAGFVAMVVVRSLGVLPDGVLDAAKAAETWLLAAAMFALGTSVHWRVLRRAGGRPVLLAGLATLIVTCIGAAVAALAG